MGVPGAGHGALPVDETANQADRLCVTRRANLEPDTAQGSLWTRVAATGVVMVDGILLERGLLSWHIVGIKPYYTA